MQLPHSESAENELIHFNINTDGDLITTFHTERSKLNNNRSSTELSEFIEKLTKTEIDGPVNLQLIPLIDFESNGDHKIELEDEDKDFTAEARNWSFNHRVNRSIGSSKDSIFEQNSIRNEGITSFKGLITTLRTILLYLTTTRAASDKAFEYITGHIKLPNSEISLTQLEGWIWIQSEVRNRVSLDASKNSDSINMNVRNFFSNIQRDALVIREEIIVLKELVKKLCKMLHETYAYLEKLDKMGLKKFTEAASLVNQLNPSSSGNIKDHETVEKWDTGTLDYTKEWIHYDKNEIFIRTSTTEQRVSFNTNQKVDQLISASRIIHQGFRNFLTTSNLLCRHVCQMMESKPSDQRFQLKQLLRHLKMQLRSIEYMYPAQQTILHASIKKMKVLINDMESRSASLKSSIKTSIQLLECSLGSTDIDAFNTIFLNNSKFTTWRNSRNLSFTLEIETQNYARLFPTNQENENNSSEDIIKEVMKSETQLHMMIVDGDFENLYSNRLAELLVPDNEVKLMDVQLCRSKIQKVVFDCYHIIKILNEISKHIHQVNILEFSIWDNSPNQNDFTISLWLYISTECLLTFRSHCKLDENIKKRLKRTFDKCFDELSELTTISKKAGIEYMQLISMIEALISAIENEIEHCLMGVPSEVKDFKELSAVQEPDSSENTNIKLCLNLLGLTIKIGDSELQFNAMHQNLQTQLFNLTLNETQRRIRTILNTYSEAMNFTSKVYYKKYSNYNITLLINRVKDILSNSDEVTQLELIILKRSIEELQVSVKRLHLEIGFLNPFRIEKLLKELNVSKKLVLSCFSKKKDASELTHISNILGRTVEIPVKSSTFQRDLSSVINSSITDSALPIISPQNVSSKYLELLQKSKIAVASSEKLMKYLTSSQVAVSIKLEKSIDKVLCYDALSTLLLLTLLEVCPKLDKRVLNISKTKQKSIRKISSKISHWIKRSLNQKLDKMEDKFRSIISFRDVAVQQLKLNSVSEIDSSRRTTANYIKLNWNVSQKHLLFSDYSMDMIPFSEISSSKREDTILRILQLLKYKTTFIKKEFSKCMKLFKEFYSSTKKLTSNIPVPLGPENLILIEMSYSNFKHLKQLMEFIYLRMESLQAKLEIGINLIKNQEINIKVSKRKFSESRNLETTRLQNQIYEIPIPLEIHVNY